LASISAQRNTEPAKLTKLLRGELDWIVMTALEKDRNRRYETPARLRRMCSATWTTNQCWLVRNRPVIASTSLLAGIRPP